MNGSRDAIIDGALLVWFVLTALSTAYVAWDAFSRNPEMRVMRWGWLLVTLYTGPVGGALYVLSCQEPAPGGHENFIRPMWKQSLGSTIHCMAGDATGIIVAATITAALGLPMGLDLVSEYVFGFLFGLLIFQALFMREMLGGSYLRAVQRSILPEWLSMNGVMAGMIPVMAVLMSRDMRAMEASSPRFWGVMSLASLAGLLLSYPVNVWLVMAGLKHGMGTVRVLGQGGHSTSAEMEMKAATAAAAVKPSVAGHASHGASSPDPVGGTAAPTPAIVRPPTRAQLAAVTLLTMVALGAGVLIAALYGDLSMRPGMTRPGAMPGMPVHRPM